MTPEEERAWAVASENLKEQGLSREMAAAFLPHFYIPQPAQIRWHKLTEDVERSGPRFRMGNGESRSKKQNVCLHAHLPTSFNVYASQPIFARRTPAPRRLERLSMRRENLQSEKRHLAPAAFGAIHRAGISVPSKPCSTASWPCRNAPRRGNHTPTSAFPGPLNSLPTTHACAYHPRM